MLVLSQNACVGVCIVPTQGKQQLFEKATKRKNGKIRKGNMSQLVRLYRHEGALEYCYCVQTARHLTGEEFTQLFWLIAETFKKDKTSLVSFLDKPQKQVLTIGPRLTIETPFSSNCVAACRASGLKVVERVECFVRYSLDTVTREEITAAHLDKMTQLVYDTMPDSLELHVAPAPVKIIPVFDDPDSLRKFNAEQGMGLDDQDLAHYMDMFKRLGRNSPDVELFQLGNMTSEHCRHGYWKAYQEIDGVIMPHSLMEIIRAPLQALGTDHNSLAAFNDNSGIFRGGLVRMLIASDPGRPSKLITMDVLLHITHTAETHNHPVMWAPFPGAETKVGGRIRDNWATGRGAIGYAGFAGYCVGTILDKNGRPLWKPGSLKLNTGDTYSFANPLQVLIEGSNGASSYGNKIGEPLIGGFTRSFGMVVDGERREFLKPVFYGAGVGRIADVHVKKREPQVGMKIVRIGGPAHRVGVGGGSASSIASGTNDQKLDFKSVQRGNPEYENRANRVLRTCVEMLENNPIESIHDQGAGGPSNVLTELMEPLGGKVDIRKITVADKSMSVLEIWVAEFQEGYGLLIRPERLEQFQRICRRERVNCEVVGEITGDGHVEVVDSSTATSVVHLKLDDILGKLPRKTFKSERKVPNIPPLVIPDDLTVDRAIQLVFRLPQVGSKGFLTRKVDRSVTGRVAAQQCCGPAQIPVGNVGVTADGYYSVTGAANALGEAPNIMLVDPAAGARMAFGETLTNLAAAHITDVKDIKVRVNWMWAAKQPYEGARLYDAACAVRDVMIELGIAADGGKDSLSMSVKIGDQTVKSPGQMVVFGGAPVRDITKVATPDIKHPGRSTLGLIEFSVGKNRLGGSSLAQALGQLGNEVPDFDDVPAGLRALKAKSMLHGQELILSLHDRSDGGLITCIAEMCMAGYSGADIDLPQDCSRLDAFAKLFSQELGFVIEYDTEKSSQVENVVRLCGATLVVVGKTTTTKRLRLSCDHVSVDRHITELRQWWEETSDALEVMQANPKTVEMEKLTYTQTMAPRYVWRHVEAARATKSRQPRVAILREEGTNGDEELAAAFHMAGFETVPFNMQDLLDGAITLDDFQGLAFPGGFSFMDVCDSGKAWAAVIKFNTRLRDMFERFYHRPDTFSFGVCNGCQFMALLGWVPFKGLAESEQPRFIHNVSGRFESRWSTVCIQPSPAIMFQGMEGSVLGIHSDHGEGLLHFNDKEVRSRVITSGLVPVSYVDPEGTSTGQYPFCPNGSLNGFCGLCSEDGRHLAMMPHSERCFLKWQWPWMPEKWRTNMSEPSPWLQMFINARNWCLEHQVGQQLLAI
jgi:phosphoribosylformylglycinamidine synthase